PEPPGPNTFPLTAQLTAQVTAQPHNVIAKEEFHMSKYTNRSQCSNRVHITTLHASLPNMKHLLLGVVFIVLSISAREAAAQAWCKADGVSKPFGGGDVKSALTRPDPLDALPDLVVVSCWPDDDAKGRMKEIEAARAKWSQKLDLTEADWNDVAVWAMAQQSS